MISISIVHLLRKVFSRLMLIYLFLYIIPFPLGYFPLNVGTFFSDAVNTLWKWLTPLVADTFFGYKPELSFQGRGSGDTVYDYFLVPTRFFCALILILVWSTWDKLKKSDTKIWRGLTIVLRYYLAFTMFVYGFSKIFYLQFPELNLMNLTGIYGDSSPMGLLWRFMGHSEAYSIFTGVMEVLGGLFLLFRCTKVLGAFITMGILLNVFVLNMTFDVPVKLFSFHLLLMSLIILLPDIKNVLRFFVLNSPTRPEPISSYFSERKKIWLGYGLKMVLIVYVLFTTIESKIESQKLYGKKVPKNMLYGIYDIQDYKINSKDIPPLLTDSDRWKQLIIDKRSSLVVKIDGRRVGMQHDIDSLNHSIKLTPFLEGEQSYYLSFHKTDSTLVLTEVRREDTLTIEAKRKKREDFFLVNRGFHWINEYPMNR